uniref:BCS1 N-terminal domain-containing protein n=1 Tax=Fusarium oxysporum (strain Fo5176) TaxID=660025 RepID=A0A0D2Y895_FUSOF
MPASLRGTVVSESEVPQPHVSALTSPLRYTLLGIKGPWGFSVIEPVFRHLPAGPWPSVRKLITLPVERKYGDGRGIEEAKGIHIGRVAYGGAHVGPNVCTRGRNGKKSASFLSEQQGVATNRRLAAQTTFHGAWDGENSAEIMATTSIEESEDSPKYLNFAGDAASYSSICPSYGYDRILAQWDLFSNAKRAHFLKTRGKTRIYRPKITESRLEANNMWHPVAVRPIRPLKTVILEDKVKHAILRDMNDYLHPVAYNCEGDLAVMFTKLPRRCVVLLEDIDTAGLCRPNDDENDEDTEEASEDVNGKVKNTEKTEKEEKKSKPKKAKGPSSDTDSSEEGTKRHRRHKRRRRNMKKGNRGTKNILFAESISLSGLLNAIDGVASHEGRILIMTTNKPESLDEALVRPGRVDLQVGFKNATSEQARQLFYRMYEVSPTKPVPNAKAGSAAPNALKGSLLHNQDKEATLPDEELTKISQDFGRLIPDDMFSPAEIQGFLLKRKKNPQKALGDAAAWAEATLKQKRLNSKVATVQ